MIKKFLLVVMIAVGAAPLAQADLVFSTSSTDVNAGSNLTLTPGSSGSMFVWVSTAADQTVNGLSLDINSSNPSVLQTTAHLIQNPSGLRWNGINSGTLGDLVNDSNAVAIVAPFGVNTGGLGNFVLHSEIQFNATGLGTTDLTFGEGNFLVTTFQSSNSIWNTWQKGTGTVSVQAIPEPGSFVLIALAGLALAARRRR